MTYRNRIPFALVLAVALAGAAACKSPSSPPAAPSSHTAASRSSAAHAQPASSVGAGLPSLKADPRESMLARSVAAMLETEHLLHLQLNNKISEEAFKEYLEDLDGAKLFLLKKQVAELGRFRDLMDNEMHDGNLKLARVGAAILKQRQQLVGKMVLARLKKPFDFSRKETVETDPKKLHYCGSEAELADRWRRLLKLQVLQKAAQMKETAEALARGKKHAGMPDAGVGPTLSLADIPKTFAGRAKKARAELSKSYSARFARLAEIEPLEPDETFINAITAVYDPHTLYMPPEQREDFNIEMSGSLQGIGAVLSEQDHNIVVRDIVPGGASWRQGELAPGDVILAVAQGHGAPVDLTDMRIDKAVQLIRGPKGTVVTLTVKKPDKEIKTISITRDIVHIEASFARGAIFRRNKKSRPMGYINLPSFYGNTRAHTGAGSRNAIDDVHRLLDVFNKRKVAGVIIDLRQNGGGLLSDARGITGLFIKTGPVVQTLDSDGNLDVLKDRDPSVVFRGPVVVLVDRFSASASEILAGALQDYGRAVIVGTGPTHGKGTVQVLADLNRITHDTGKRLGVLKLTVDQFFRIDGASTQIRGVVPNIVLPDPASYIKSREKYLDYAIPWKKIKPLKYHKWQGHWSVADLARRSKARQAKDPEFAKITKRSALLEARSKDTIVPLERTAWLAKRKKDRAHLAALDPKLEDGPPLFTVKAVDYTHDATKYSSTPAEKARMKKRLDRWRNNLAHDPWASEGLNVLTDMVHGK